MLNILKEKFGDIQSIKPIKRLKFNNCQCIRASSSPLSACFLKVYKVLYIIKVINMSGLTCSLFVMKICRLSGSCCETTSVNLLLWGCYTMNTPVMPDLSRKISCCLLKKILKLRTKLVGS